MGHCGCAFAHRWMVGSNSDSARLNDLIRRVGQSAKSASPRSDLFSIKGFRPDDHASTRLLHAEGPACSNDPKGSRCDCDHRDLDASKIRIAPFGLGTLGGAVQQDVDRPDLDIFPTLQRLLKGCLAVWNNAFHHSTVIVVTGRNPAHYSDHHGTGDRCWTSRLMSLSPIRSSTTRSPIPAAGGALIAGQARRGCGH